MILKLNFLRTLRKAKGSRYKDMLSTWEENVYDSSHIVGAMIIRHYMQKKVRAKKRAQGIPVPSSVVNSYDY